MENYVRLSEGKAGRPGKAVYFEIRVWRNEKTGDIHITAPGPHGFLTVVNNREGSARCHNNLYQHLKAVLERHNRWSAVSTDEHAPPVQQKIWEKTKRKARTLKTEE